mgnify:FL=1
MKARLLIATSVATVILLSAAPLWADPETPTEDSGISVGVDATPKDEPQAQTGKKLDRHLLTDQNPRLGQMERAIRALQNARKIPRASRNSRNSANERRQNGRLGWLAKDRNELFRRLGQCEKKLGIAQSTPATPSTTPQPDPTTTPTAPGTTPATPRPTPPTQGAPSGSAPGQPAIYAPQQWGDQVVGQSANVVLCGGADNAPPTTDTEEGKDQQPDGLLVRTFFDADCDGSFSNEPLAGGVDVVVLTPDGYIWKLQTGAKGGWLLPTSALVEGEYLLRAGEREVSVSYPETREVFVPLAVYAKTLGEIQAQLEAVEQTLGKVADDTKATSSNVAKVLVATQDVQMSMDRANNKLGWVLALVALALLVALATVGLLVSKSSPPATAGDPPPPS